MPLLERQFRVIDVPSNYDMTELLGPIYTADAARKELEELQADNPHLTLVIQSRLGNSRWENFQG